IWTPWFSMLGSKSGFDSIQECFEDLTPQIFAVETGLSSDPEMNWRVKNLDGLTLISNSDAHSPMKLGREASIFNTDLSYVHIKNAIKTGDPELFLGTFEFFPEEGKYHIDGHRKCHHRSWPTDTIQTEGICPVCSKPMTLGVLYRVEQLAERPLGAHPEKHHPFHHIIPLNEILSELLGVGPNTKKVNKVFNELLNSKGPELKILHDLPIKSLYHGEVPLLGEAIKRVRNKDIHVFPGYDGEFGRIQVFTAQEKERMRRHR
ncbi:MAG: endonuclease Q family protein, partial [Desulfobacterales bacterium]|nr:endonuclease Q family protein [Desulfobacterales bacterium]MDX2513551.1 endonuclease Q family protein [Desulfobacterales bacterium]